MSVEDLLIHFQYGEEENIRRQRQFYVPGDEMRGVVSLHLRSALRIRSLNIFFLGTASVSWESEYKKRVYQASDIHLDSAKPLMDIGADDMVELPRGLHQFGFRFQLPANLPSTFNGVYGQVTYLTKVKLESEDERNTTITSEPFLVLRRPELPPEMYKEVKLKKGRYFLGFNSGKVKVDCTIDKCAAMPGDNIVVDGEVSNWTGREISLIQASVIVEGHYFAEGHEIVFRQYLSKRDDVYDVNHLRGRRWRHVLLPVPPYLADSGLEHCRLINIKYFFQFKVRIEGKEDIALETPLYVGTQPIDYSMDGQDLLGGRMWQGMQAIENDPRQDQPWYGGRSLYTESVNGDFFDVRT